MFFINHPVKFKYQPSNLRVEYYVTGHWPPPRGHIIFTFPTGCGPEKGWFWNLHLSLAWDNHVPPLLPFVAVIVIACYNPLQNQELHCVYLTVIANPVSSFIYCSHCQLPDGYGEVEYLTSFLSIMKRRKSAFLCVDHEHVWH
jgi:hypothetical protein